MPGHGLQLIAVLYDMPLKSSVRLQVVRPVSDVSASQVPRVYNKTRRLQYSRLRKAHFLEYIYFLDEDYNLVPGQWEIRVWDGNRILLREYHEVYGDVDCALVEC